MDSTGAKINLKAIPAHKWLVVEYAASWCAPCVVQEKQLSKVFASIKNASDYAWITIDMTRVPDVEDAIKKVSKTYPEAHIDSAA
jgi:thiol:disulfide interchange protein